MLSRLLIAVASVVPDRRREREERLELADAQERRGAEEDGGPGDERRAPTDRTCAPSERPSAASRPYQTAEGDRRRQAPEAIAMRDVRGQDRAAVQPPEPARGAPRAAPACPRC